MISEHLLGWITLLIIILIIFLIVNKNPKTINFLFVALVLRSICVIVDQYIFPLPGNSMDAWTFEQFAFNFSQKDGLDVVHQLLDGDSYFLSKIISIFYTLIDRSSFMAKMFSVGFGTAAVFLIYHLTLILWGTHAASKAGWFAAFFPSLVLYSAIIMREIYVVFFLTYALIGCVNFIDKRKVIYFIKLFFGFFIAALFHGPLILGFFIFLIYFFVKILMENNYFLNYKIKNIYDFLLLPLILIPFIAYFLGYYTIPKIGNIKDIGESKTKIIKIVDGKIIEIIPKNQKELLTSFEKRIIWKMNKARTQCHFAVCAASYPEWTVPKKIEELSYLIPVRFFYLLYAPFPWDIKRAIHLVGLFDAFFYIYLSFCILRNRKSFYKNPQILFLITVLIAYIILYSLGVGNFGTGMRHRLKFIGILIAIAAPTILRIKFSKIK
jgi:hypothetical protein